jgi:class 3 adenylate cyclase
MLRNRDDGGAVPEPRYDTATLRQVTALAERLKERRLETITAREMEAVGAEVGLSPAFVQQALEQLRDQRAAPSNALARAEETERRVELRATIFCLSFPWLLGLLAYLCRHQVGIVALFDPTIWLLVTPILGFLAPKKRVAILSALGLVVALAPTLGEGVPEYTSSNVAIMAAITIPLALGAAKLREWYDPYPSTRRRRLARRPVSRADLLAQLFELQARLEHQKQHRACLSVDVVGSSEMKRSTPELAVEHSFHQFRGWVEEIVLSGGGEVQQAAGDGLLAIFSDDTTALRSARRLQEELAHFNAERNRLPTPFRIRCGVSAGDVAMADGMPLGHVQSPVIDRAAHLQKQGEPNTIMVSSELAGAAMTALGQLTPLPAALDGESAFMWQGREPIGPDEPE